MAPRTSENFRGLCTGEYNNSRTGKPMHYKGTRFTRIIPNFVVQAVRDMKLWRLDNCLGRSWMVNLWKEIR